MFLHICVSLWLPFVRMGEWVSCNMLRRGCREELATFQRLFKAMVCQLLYSTHMSLGKDGLETA